MTNNTFKEAYPVALRIAVVRSALFVANVGLPPDSRRDFEQEVLLELWRKLPRLDPQRASWSTFAEKVAANRIASLRRCLYSARGGHGREGSLSEVHWSIPASDDHIELRIDVMRVLLSVSKFDRIVACYLINHSVVETSRLLAVSRQAIYRAINRLRAAFISAGVYGGGVVNSEIQRDQRSDLSVEADQ